MRGFPKWINSRADLENLRGDFPAQTRAFMQDIYDHREQWMVVGKLAADDAGREEPGRFKVVEKDNTESGGGIDRYQYELKEDPNGTIFRLGFASSAEFLVFLEAIPVAATL